MADNLKYYYLKLKDNFFESEELMILESMQDGYMYSNILLKLYLKALKGGGRLMFNDRIPYNSQMLSTITRHSVGDIEKAIKLFKELNLIEILDNGAIYMTDIQNFIGKSSTEADRKREYRTAIQSEKQAIGQMSGQISDKSTPEIEIEIELERELEIDKDILSSKHDDASNDTPKEKRTSEVYADIIGYLNDQTGASYKSTTTATRKKIDARLNEGYTLDDFKTVISKKVAEWQDTDMAKYLRPETLFGTKFESYLNQVSKVKTMNKLQRLYERYAEEEK